MSSAFFKRLLVSFRSQEHCVLEVDGVFIVESKFVVRDGEDSGAVFRFSANTDDNTERIVPRIRCSFIVISYHLEYK